MEFGGLDSTVAVNGFLFIQRNNLDFKTFLGISHKASSLCTCESSQEFFNLSSVLSRVYTFHYVLANVSLLCSFFLLSVSIILELEIVLFFHFLFQFFIKGDGISLITFINKSRCKSRRNHKISEKNLTYKKSHLNLLYC